MRGSSSWRSLRWVMMLTAHVALVSIVVRSVAGPVATPGMSAGWSALALVVAGSLLLPVAFGVSGVMFPRIIGDDRRCPRCGRAELQPIRAAGSGLFEPAEHFRCGACWTAYGLEGDALVEGNPPGSTRPAGSPGIWFLEGADVEASAQGIEFLGEVSRTSPIDPCPQDIQDEAKKRDRPGARRR